MASLDRNILRSSISLPAKLRLYYRVFVLPIIQSITQQLARILDAFDMWCLRRTLYAFPGGPAFLMKRSTADVLISHHSCTSSVPLALSSSVTLHVPIHLRTCVAPLPMDWNHQSGRPRHTRFWTVESDLAPLNIGPATAYCRAQNRQAWSTLIGTATFSTGQAT